MPIRDDDVLKDPVFRKLGKVPSSLFQDPYHRYRRVVTQIERSFGIDRLRGADALDLGCLRPELASLLVRTYGCRVTACDRWDMPDSWPEVELEFVQTDLDSPWPETLSEKRFDVVFALEVLEHMIDTDRFLEQVRGVLADDGVLALSTPNINSLRNRAMVPLGAYPAGLEWRNIIHHVRLYNVRCLREQLVAHGLVPRVVRGTNLLPYRGPMTNRLYRAFSEWLADRFPSLSQGIIVLATKAATGTAAP